MNVPFVDLKAQYRRYATEIDAAIKGVLQDSSFIMGPEVGIFEKAMVRFTGAKHAIACASGTDALLLALMAIDFKPGEEVITTPFTFVSTAQVVHLLGGRAVFVDIEHDTYNIDASRIEEKITPRTRAIVPVSLFGQCCDMDAINAIAHRHGLVVIEDAAQSFGATYNGRRSCNLSALACTSFYPAKPLGGFGDGGAVFTSNDTWAEKIRSLLNNGQTTQYTYEHVGICARLDTLQAAVLNVKLARFPEELARRQACASRYTEALTGTKAILPSVRQGCTSAWAQYSIRVKDRERFQAGLAEAGIPTRVYYPVPLHRQKPYLTEGDFRVCDEVAKDIVSLPICAFLDKKNQDFICEQAGVWL